MVMKLCSSEKCDRNKRCRTACEKMEKKVQTAICSSKKCRANKMCTAYCKAESIKDEFEDFEDIQDIDVDASFDIELINIDGLEYEREDPMLAALKKMCKTRKCLGTKKCRKMCMVMKLC